MTNEVFGWGLIGCRGAGRAHAKYATIEPDVTVRAFCDVDAGTAERFAAEHFKTATFTRPNAASGEHVIETVKPPEAPRLCDLVSAIRTGRDPAIGARERIHSAVLVQCIEASIRTGEAQAVKMPAF